MAKESKQKEDEMRFKSSITLNEKDPSGKDVEVIEKMNRVRRLPKFRFMNLSDLARYFLVERADQELKNAGEQSFKSAS